MDFLVDAHNILFLMQALYSFIIGVYAAWLGARDQTLSGNFFGTIAVYAILNIVVLALGVFLLFSNYAIESGGRTFIYVLYMLYLVVILPGIFSVMQGRDDKSAAITFGAAAMFNATVSYSMFARGLASWAIAA